MCVMGASLFQQCNNANITADSVGAVQCWGDGNTGGQASMLVQVIQTGVLGDVVLNLLDLLLHSEAQP